MITILRDWLKLACLTPLLFSLSCKSKQEQERADQLGKSTVVLKELDKLDSSEDNTTSSNLRLDQLDDKREEELIDAEALLKKRSPTPSPKAEEFTPDTTAETTPSVTPSPSSTPGPTLTPSPAPSPTPDNESPLFTREELAEIERLSKSEPIKSLEDRFIGGVRRKRSPEVINNPVEINDEDKKKEDDQDEANTGVELTGQARGYAMLYLMHPRARNTVERELQAMLDSKVRELFLGVLVDGTFGSDFDYLSSVVQRISLQGRVLYLALYLTNGPTQRAYDVTDIDVAFNKIEPGDFRYKIQNDSNIRSQFLSIVRKAKQIFDINKRLNPQNVNIAVMMLEDNLDSNSYQAMRLLARSVLGNNVIYMRNPCPGCYEGNDSYAFGDRVEIHDPSVILSLEKDDGFSMDGKGLLYEDEVGNGVPPNVTEVLMAQAMESKLAYFALWRAARQGLYVGKRLHPDNRNYEVPTPEQLEVEIELLRSNLIPLEQNPPEP